MTTMEIHTRVKNLLTEGFATTKRANETLEIVKAAEKEDPAIRSKMLPLGADVIKSYTELILATSDLMATYKMWLEDDTDEIVTGFIGKEVDHFHTGLMALNTALDAIDSMLDEVTK